MPDFETDPLLLLEQASAVTVVKLSDDDYGLAFRVFAPIVAPAGYRHDDHGMMQGQHIVVYPSTEEGVVDSWKQRYYSFGVNFDHAILKLRFQYLNGFAVLEDVIDLSDDERERLNYMTS